MTHKKNCIFVAQQPVHFVCLSHASIIVNGNHSLPIQILDVSIQGRTASNCLFTELPARGICSGSISEYAEQLSVELNRLS